MEPACIIELQVAMLQLDIQQLAEQGALARFLIWRFGEIGKDRQIKTCQYRLLYARLWR